jgi:hypothetical protein
MMERYLIQFSQIIPDILRGFRKADLPSRYLTDWPSDIKAEYVRLISHPSISLTSQVTFEADYDRRISHPAVSRLDMMGRYPTKMSH